MTKETFRMNFAGRELVVETGQVAKQANGAVIVRYGDTTVLTAATMSKKWQTVTFSLCKLIMKKNVCRRKISWRF